MYKYKYLIADIITFILIHRTCIYKIHERCISQFTTSPHLQNMLNMTRDVNIFPYFIYVFKSMSLVLKMIDLYDLLPLITVHNKYNKFLYGQVL